MEVPRAWPLSEARRAAQTIITGQLGILEGCIDLAALSHEIVPDWRIDPDFVVFGAVASETHDWPFGEVRKLWSDNALAKADAAAARLAERWRVKVLRACENILRRFPDTGVAP